MMRGRRRSAKLSIKRRCAEDSSRQAAGIALHAVECAPASWPQTAATTSELPPRLAACSTASRKLSVAAKAPARAWPVPRVTSVRRPVDAPFPGAREPGPHALSEDPERLRTAPSAAPYKRRMERARRQSRQASRTAGAWQVVRAASLARCTASGSSARKNITTGATRESGSGSSWSGRASRRRACAATAPWQARGRCSR